MVIPARVTILPSATFLFAKLAVAALWSSVTASPDSTPERAAEPFTRSAVADVVASYTRLLAVMPETVRVLAVTLALAAGCVSE